MVEDQVETDRHVFEFLELIGLDELGEGGQGCTHMFVRLSVFPLGSRGYFGTGVGGWGEGLICVR